MMSCARKGTGKKTCASDWKDSGQFLPAYNELLEEAFQEARDIPTRAPRRAAMEHLAICEQNGRDETRCERRCEGRGFPYAEPLLTFDLEILGCCRRQGAGSRRCRNLDALRAKGYGKKTSAY